MALCCNKPNSRWKRRFHSAFGVLDQWLVPRALSFELLNANRARARWVLKDLLGIDVMGLAKFEIKLDDELAEIPTLNDVGCSSCHALLDPIAGGFKNWRNKGNYREATRWTVCDEDFVMPGG